MQIPSTPAVKLLDDYDFVFTSGMMMPVTINVAVGDRISFNAETVVVYLTPKPSSTDPDRMLSSEDITIFTKHLASVQHRVREVLDLTPEQQLEWKKTIAELTIQ